jgi:hypothetical protein
LSRKPEIQVCYSACSKLVPFLSVYIHMKATTNHIYVYFKAQKKKKRQIFASSRQGLEHAQWFWPWPPNGKKHDLKDLQGNNLSRALFERNSENQNS